MIKEYISRAYALEVIKHISEDEPWQEACVNNVIRLLNELPSIDIVHCKECKYAHLTYDGSCKYCDKWKDDDDNYIEVYHDGNHFCSYGERKDERSKE